MTRKTLPSDLPPSYRYSLRSKLFGGKWWHSYDVIGARGAASFNVSGPYVHDGRENWTAGLEFHHRSPPEYMRDLPPSHDKCHVLKAPCWHDGTSLYAQEVYLPVFLRGDDAAIFRMLASAADDAFQIACEDDEGRGQ